MEMASNQVLERLLMAQINKFTCETEMFVDHNLSQQFTSGQLHTLCFKDNHSTCNALSDSIQQLQDLFYQSAFVV